MMADPSFFSTSFFRSRDRDRDREEIYAPPCTLLTSSAVLPSQMSWAFTYGRILEHRPDTMHLKKKRGEVNKE
jgi:hypothetical protein